jgi:NADH dehydrogenase
MPSPIPRHRVVVVGGGFAGLTAAKRLSRLPVDVVLVDRRNHHLFTPLAYQVATGGLAPGDVAAPLRALLARRGNVRVVLAEATGFDLDRRTVLLRDDPGSGRMWAEPYDTLLVAAGSRPHFAGHEEWRAAAPALGSLDGALDIRSRVLAAFEAAELEPDPAVRRALLTFAVIGGGPTGVELAGQLAELARDTLRGDFRAIDPSTARVLLLEGGDRVLPRMDPASSAAAQRQLAELGVTVRPRRQVTELRPEGLRVRGRGGAVAWLPARTVLWAAGVRPAPLAATLARAAGAWTDRAGRLLVTPQLHLPGRPEVFVAGDLAAVVGSDGEPLQLPGTAPVAMQEGRHVARVVGARLRGRPEPGFRFRDRGDVATIGRARAVADVHGVRFSGTLAWLFWLAIHLWYLSGTQRRLVAVIRWTAAFATHGRASRLITGGEAGAAPPFAADAEPAELPLAA